MNQIFSVKSQHFFSMAVSILICLLMAACGGGGGGSGSSTNSNSNSNSGNNNGSSGDSTNTLRSGSNVVAINLDSSVFNAVNSPFVTVTVCSTTTPSACLNIDHILVDTGSVGLRIFNQPNTTAALSTLNLSAVTDPSNPANAVGECLTFVQGNTWGPMKSATIQIGQKTASNVAIQVISDPSFFAAPSSCTGNTLMTTPTDFGANGVLGIGLTLQDCGSLCTVAANGANIYFDCSNAGCNNIAMPLINQIQNPASLFSSDNNGVILSFNGVSSSGAAIGTGTLTFGIDTETNNVSQNQNTILADSNGNFTTTFQGRTYTDSYFDSGSNGLFFNPPSNSIASCSGTPPSFYCPPVTDSFTAQITGLTGSSGIAAVSFSVANANSLFNTGNYVFNNLAGDATNIPLQGYTFDWGMPFFLGRDVYVAFEGQQTSKNTGPYFGF